MEDHSNSSTMIAPASILSGNDLSDSNQRNYCKDGDAYAEIANRFLSASTNQQLPKSFFKQMKKRFYNLSKRLSPSFVAHDNDDMIPSSPQPSPAKRNSLKEIARRISNSRWSIFSGSSTTSTITNENNESDNNNNNNNNEIDAETLKNPSIPRLNKTPSTTWTINDIIINPPILLDKSEMAEPIVTEDKREAAVRLALQTTFGKSVPVDCQTSGVMATADIKGGKKLYLKSYFVSQFQHVAENSAHDLIESFKSDTRFTGAGKSGSWMLWSKGNKYIAKSLTDIEVAKAQSMFPDYFKHLERYPSSLLTKYVGFFKMRVSGKTTYVVLMKNTLDSGDEQQWEKIYDLKGSTRGRVCESSSNLLKDINFMRAGVTMKFPNELALNKFKITLQMDIGFLLHHSVLDYSLLLGMNGNGREWKAGIIDIMTPFSPRKRVERAAMGRLHGKGTISCAPPPKYALRFFDFIQQRLEVNSA